LKLTWTDSQLDLNYLKVETAAETWKFSTKIQTKTNM